MKTVMRSIVILLALAAGAMAQSTTTITGPVSDPFGNPYSGSILIQSQAKTNFGYAITGTVQTVVVGGGVISGLALVANDVSVPNLTSYAMTFGNGDRWVCIVPTVAAPVSTTASTMASSPTITVASAAGITNGQLVGGAGIPNSTTVTGISGTTITLSQSATATASGVSVSFITTVNFATICYPNTIPPTAPAPVPVSLILPSPTNLNVVATINGQATWTSVPSLFTGCSSGAPLLSWTGACVGKGGFPSTPTSTQFWYSDSNGNPVGDSLVTHTAGGISIGTTLGGVPVMLTNPNTGGAGLRLQPASGDNLVSMSLLPSGAGTTSRIRFFNGSDINNNAQLALAVNGATLTMQTLVNGTGTPITTWNLGGASTNLTAINFQFNSTTMASLSNIGAMSFGSSAPAGGTMMQITTPANAGPGTISVTATSGTVTGTGTSFQETFNLGSTITCTATGETRTVASFLSDASMTTDAWTSSCSGAYTVGFPIGGALKWSVYQNGTLAYGNASYGNAGLIPSQRNAIALAPILVAPTGAVSLLRSTPFVTNPGGIVVGILSNPDVACITAPCSLQFNGLIGGINVDGTNTQNWTRTNQNQPAGVVGVFGGSAGATGTVTDANSVFSYFSILTGGVAVTNGYEFHGFGVSSGTASPVNAVSLALNTFTGSSNTNYILIGTDTPQAGNYGIFDSTGYPWAVAGPIRITGAAGTTFLQPLYTPSTSSTTCAAGQFSDDTGFHYVCVGTNTWKRVALSTF